MAQNPVVMDELWQLYDEHGQAIAGKGAPKQIIFSGGLLHGAAHVWIWRQGKDGSAEVLLQKRAISKNTWPGRYDISAAGHIDLGEEPLTAALRETQEEIGVALHKEQLTLIGVHRAHLTASNRAVENEFQWIYLLELTEAISFSIQTSELESVLWVSLQTFKTDCESNTYVPHGASYYDTVIAAITSRHSAGV